jgi:hypothetical protein
MVAEMLVAGTIMPMKLFKFFFIMAVIAIGSSMLTTSALAAHCTGSSIELGFPLLSGEHCIDKNAPGGPIFAYVRQLIQLLSGAVGIIVVLMLVIGGFQYITSAGDPGQVKSAKSRITNAITGLVLFVLMFALLNYLIPGGIIG